MKMLPTVSRFKENMKKQLVPTKMQLFSRGKGRSAVNHTQMRLGLSHLNQQLHSFGIVPSPHCQHCPERLETVSHYLLHCSRYTGIRTEMMADIAALVEVNGITLDIDNHRRVVNILLLRKSYIY